MKLLDLFTNGEQFTRPDHEVTHVRALDSDRIESDTLRFWDGKDQQSYIGTCVGGVMVVPIGCDLFQQDHHEVTVFSADPKASFMRAFQAMYDDGLFDFTVRGQGTFMHQSVKDGERVKIGRNCTIGEPGFGFFEGKRVPHIGRVLLGDDVEIGSNTCIDRGTLGDTVIGARTKIDNLVHIAHNVRIGTDCQIVAGAVIGGSAVLGDRVFVGINASIKNKVRIGDGATIGMGAVVLHDVPAGATVVGNPARILEPKPATA